jgi:Tol biopolymer transport system component
VGLLLAITLAVVVASLNNMPRNPVFGDNGVIAFEVGPLRPHEGSFHTINPDGTGERDFGSARSLGFSTDGRSLMLVRGFEDSGVGSDLIVADPDGSNERRVTEYASNGAAVAPDGSEIAVPYTDDTGVTGQIAAYSAADGSVRELLPAPPGYDETYYEIDEAAWSPDGQYVAVSLWRRFPGDIYGPYRVGIVVVDTTTLDAKTVSTRMADMSAFAWSPDSRSLVFNGWVDGTPGPSASDEFIQRQSQLFAVDIDTLVETALTDEGTGLGAPRWAPDGSSIAYISSAAIDSKVVVVDLDDAGNPTTSRVGPVAHQVEWAPDATELLISYTDFVDPVELSEADVGVLQIIDRDLASPPRTLVTIQGGVGAISWQRLDP